jgi:sulfite exporter TauE/SafE
LQSSVSVVAPESRAVGHYGVAVTRREAAFAERTPEGAARRSLPLTFLAGAAIGVLGGLIGLGGAEFRLPLLIGVFGFVALQAVILDKAMSLIVVLTALPARLLSIPFSEVAGHWSIIANLLAGSLVGAWLGATWATRMRSATLYRVLAVLLVLIAVALRPLQPGRQLRRPRSAAGSRPRDGGWVRRGHPAGRTAAGCRPGCRADPAAGRTADRLGVEGLAPPVTGVGASYLRVLPAARPAAAATSTASAAKVAG